MSDFKYRDDGLFVLITPENEQAVEVWNSEIAPKTDNTGKVLSVQFPAIREQLEQAGYTVAELQQVSDSDTDTDLLDNLFS